MKVGIMGIFFSLIRYTAVILQFILINYVLEDEISTYVHVFRIILWD